MITNCLFAIGIPTINRADLLNPTLERYVQDFPGTQIYVVDNGHQELFRHPNISVILPDRNLGVAGSWNVLCQAIFYRQCDEHTICTIPAVTPVIAGLNDPKVIGPECFYAWLLNDDVYSGRKEEEIIGLLDYAMGPAVPFYAAPGSWSSFVLPRSCYEDVGPFDERFYPAYYEDNDYRYRMKREGIKYLKAKCLDPVEFRGSSSIEKDVRLREGVPENLAYYQRKWGGVPEEETFRVPFDGKPEKTKKPL